jgi:hypothetical protein
VGPKEGELPRLEGEIMGLLRAPLLASATAKPELCDDASG